MELKHTNLNGEIVLAKDLNFNALGLKQPLEFFWNQICILKFYNLIKMIISPQITIYIFSLIWFLNIFWGKNKSLYDFFKFLSLKNHSNYKKVHFTIKFLIENRGNYNKHYGEVDILSLVIHNKFDRETCSMVHFEILKIPTSNCHRQIIIAPNLMANGSMEAEFSCPHILFTPQRQLRLGKCSNSQNSV